MNKTQTTTHTDLVTLLVPSGVCPTEYIRRGYEAMMTKFRQSLIEVSNES